MFNSFPGGPFPISVKNETPRTIMNEAGIYIACNKVPDFKSEQENVERRLAIFTTKTMPVLHPEATQWMQDNAMQCLVWMTNEINRNVELLEPEERFYEKYVLFQLLLEFEIRAQKQ